MQELIRFQEVITGLTERIRQGADQRTLLQEIRRQLDHPTALELLEWLLSNPSSCPDQLLRLLQYAALMTQPIRTTPHTTAYEWAGKTLQRLFSSEHPIAEVWPFFSGSQAPALIEGGARDPLSPLTLDQLLTHAPELLGPQGVDPDHGNQKYFFVKFLDPSDFPPFAYVGFRPEALEDVRRDLEREQRRPFAGEAEYAEALKKYLANVFWQDRRLTEQVATHAQPHVTTQDEFRRLKTSFKEWAIAQATANWEEPLTPDQIFNLASFLGGNDSARPLLVRLQQVRRQIVTLMHRIDFEEGQAILIETPTLHAIAGLSLQVHPKAPGNFYPKDELWIYQPMVDARQQRIGWILVEPQRTFDKTESGADFFTPFAWKDGALAFRKMITPDYLEYFVSLTDLTPHPRDHYLRTAQPMTCPGGSTSGHARWFRVVEEPAWPYFLVRELRFTGPGTATTPLAHHSFSELHATQGAIALTLSASGGRTHRFSVTPTSPAMLPATLPYDTVTYHADGPARLLFFTRHSRTPSNT